MKLLAGFSAVKAPDRPQENPNIFLLINMKTQFIFIDKTLQGVNMDAQGPLPPGWDMKFDKRTGRQ